VHMHIIILGFRGQVVSRAPAVYRFFLCV
jgi:hypothetical protein